VQQFVLDLGKWRFLTDPISHACWAGIAGYFIGLAVQRPRPRRSFASGPAPFASAVMTFGHLTARHRTGVVCTVQRGVLAGLPQPGYLLRALPEGGLPRTELSQIQP
jgi:hypothetical protein